MFAHCGGLNENGLIGTYVWIAGGTIWEGLGVSLWVGSEVSKAQIALSLCPELEDKDISFQL